MIILVPVMLRHCGLTLYIKFSVQQSFYCFHHVAFVRPELEEALDKSPQEQQDKTPFH